MANDLDQFVGRRGSCQSKRRRAHLNVGCWNMRRQVEAEGAETSVVRPSGRGMTVDWKAALMVYELKKYDVNVAGISETKWFGQEV